MASYPGSAKVFTTKSDGPGNTILAAHINDLQSEVTAIEQDLIAGLPIARGGTGLTGALAANRIPYSNGSAFTSAATFTFDGTTVTLPATAITALLDVSGASAGQVKFPASQNASADANTLDDYEEGTFTPTDASGASLSLATARGNYIKSGQLVVATVDVVYPATVSGATALIGSFPFTSGSYGSVTLFGAAIALTSYSTPITAYCQAATASMGFFTFGGVAITNANLTGATMRATLIYRANG